MISYGNIGEDGAAAAEKALSDNTTLARLSLAHNNLNLDTIQRLDANPRIVVEHFQRDENMVGETEESNQPEAAVEDA